MTWRPSSTYRLQLHAGFAFGAAEGIVDYLHALGVGAVYASPILRAEKGSLHGYNLVDPTMIHPELGTEEAFRAWTDALHAKRIGLIVDIVPNHMGIATDENAWWNDVLENGPSSLFADYFDIDWNPPKPGLRDHVLLPILGAQYGEALEEGELSLAREGGTFGIRYFEHRLPVSLPTVVTLLEAARAKLRLPPAQAGGSVPPPPPDPAVEELTSIITAMGHLPASNETAPTRRAERAREKEVIKRRLAALCADSPVVAMAIDEAVATTNGMKGDARSFDALDELLRQQSYRLSSWRVATEEINYRRFFDVNQLAAVRMEERAVFDAAHALVFKLIGEGAIDGLRLDHTDGLYDPAEYFHELQRAVSALRGKGDARPLYLVAEKILEPGEALPRAWPIAGTTGYDFLAAVSGLFVDGSAESAMTDVYRKATGVGVSFESLALACKRSIMRSSLPSEINMLAQALERLAESRRRSRDFTLLGLTTAIVETIAAFPVYRTYIRADGSSEPNDEKHIDRAIRVAKRNAPELNATVFDFLRDMIRLRVRQLVTDEQMAAQIRFAMRFQQLTGPVMAKGVEDTAFFRFNRLISLNEVGGQPGSFGTSVEEFHAGNAARLGAWPLSMVATSTHDTKRGEDVRARISVLSEMPEAWGTQVEEWAQIGRAHESVVFDEPAPSDNDRYYFFQTAVGAYPLATAAAATGQGGDFARRLGEHMTKATKEAKAHTSWVNPHEEYDAAVQKFVSGMMRDPRFTLSLAALAQRISTYGASNGLAMAALKLASPGVADVYQGCEVWNASLADPDNRRPVDFAAMRQALASVERAPSREHAAGLLACFEDGRVKLHVSRTLLGMRREAPELFLDGTYRPLEGGEHVVAFAREWKGRELVVAVTRLPLKRTGGEAKWALGPVWGDARLSGLGAGEWRDSLSGEVVVVEAGGARLAQVFSALPVAVLVRENNGTEALA